MKTKQNTSAGRMIEAPAMNKWCLIPGVMARGVGLLQALQDDIHHLQDVASYARVPGDP
jgi:hypothetical protein